VKRADGSIVTDADIVTGNAIIQVKSGGGKGLGDHVARTEAATGTVTIGLTISDSMQTLIMLANTNITLQSLIKAVSCTYDPKYLGETGFVIERPRASGTAGYVRAWRLDRPHRQYQEDEILPLPIGPETRGFLIEFNDLALLKEVMPYLAGREDVAIDDDHGNVVPGTDFVRALRTSAALSWLPADYETWFGKYLH